MKKLDARYTIAMFTGLLIFSGMTDFVLKNNPVVALPNFYFEFPLGLIVMNEYPMGKGLRKISYFFFVFLSFYLPVKVMALLGIKTITLTFIPYLIVLSTLLVIFSTGLFLKSKEDNSIK